ncbi:MAG: hypothetical protein ACYDG0_03600 [Vulcanimicrobiaceae bacterium]
MNDNPIPQIAQYQRRVEMNFANLIRAQVARTHPLEVTPLASREPKVIVTQEDIDQQVTIFGNRPIEHEPRMEDALAPFALSRNAKVFG